MKGWLPQARKELQKIAGALLCTLCYIRQSTYTIYGEP